MEGSPTLPPEILALIFSYLPPEIHFPSSSQSTLCSAALVCRGWYSSAISELYRAPLVRPSNFDFFVRAVCPPINAHVRHNGLAGFIRRLDLSYLVHNASKSLTARLLGRVKYTLEEFIAPQASFGINCLAAISKCSHLRCLDLRYVSEGIPLLYLLHSIQTLDKMVILHLPRAASHATSIHQGSESSANWPQNLRELHFNANFLQVNSVFLSEIPPSTTAISIEHNPSPGYSILRSFLEKTGSQLMYLRLSLHLGTTDWVHLQVFGEHCVNLEHLSINLELLVMFWKPAFRSSSTEPKKIFFPNVKVLEIDSRATSDDPRIDQDLSQLSDIFFDPELMIPKLRKLLVYKQLKRRDRKVRTQILMEIDSLFKALAREDWENSSLSEDEAGVAFVDKR